MGDWLYRHHFPRPGQRLDLVAGVRTCLDAGGGFTSLAVGALDPAIPKKGTEPIRRETHVLRHRRDIERFRDIADAHAVEFFLGVPGCLTGVGVVSYHHHEEQVLGWYADPVCWGRGPDGAALAAARATGAAYVLASTSPASEVKDHFFRDGDGYRVALPPRKTLRGHRMLWIDICPDMGGVLPVNFLEAARREVGGGYTRHLFVGADNPDW